MRAALTAVFLLFCVSAALASDATCNSPPSEPEDRRTNKGQLNIVTYNPEWLFLSNEEDPSACPEVGCMYPTLQAAMDHVRAIAKELQALNADVVNLVEVEGCAVLDALIAEIGPSYGYRAYLTPGTDTYTGQNCALLTRIDPTAPLQRTDTKVAFPVSNSTCPGTIVSEQYGVSKHYYARLNATGTIVNLFGLHFLSQPDNPERCFKREAQAQVISDYVNEAVGLAEHVVMLGDMNDFDPGLADINDDVPISNTLPILRQPFRWERELFNVGSLVPMQAQRFSNWWDRNDDCQFSSNELSLIDHFLLDARLQRSVVSAAYVHSYAPTCATAISDHWPIQVVIDTE